MDGFVINIYVRHRPTNDRVRVRRGREMKRGYLYNVSDLI